MPTARRLPGGLLWAAAPYVASFVADTSMRVASTKVKSELGWRPQFPRRHGGIQAMTAPALARR